MTMSSKPSLVIFSSATFRRSIRDLRWWWLGLPLVLALSLAAIKWFSVEQFEAETVLAPSEERGGGLADMAGGIAGLAGLAGFNLSSGKINDTQMAVEVLKSRDFLHAFIERHGLMPLLLGDEASAEELQQVWRGYNEFRERFVIEYDRAKGIVTLRMSDADAEAAASWLRLLVKDINIHMRERERARVEQQISYLTNKADEIQQADVRESLYRLLQEQYNRAMLVEVNDDYVFETIDPAVAPHQPKGLHAMTWLLVGALLGGFIMIVVTLLRSYVRSTP
ncbi:hypothetical protein PSI9734_01593 [Pseudidiomarina piscicola]|uniref:Polysaccharide chain length determinant N-terminal domain-containing protein n=1 Tax=Pseudidiomarina piscicola TaxID=2614830 RepID=A0A6S6WPK6_9GAMM|nr:hypothetical protein [Pseudidiomarina piscicola]CAB0151180.1 hypothetical protein PSI9734_01593 [Pseudidiomarina piscicola]VZT40686.1 hypothetical protein PSI9734_01593 [Pseudomonas aeruginosa]